ncbi:helix-turn-helix domain-containing protein [Oceanobacillus oncorhynchi]|uniref:helix-turn-helix domain-containing protein n=1 Tax=Oceanobacillus oncorhynchi TaxID=545501 RepID=UPI003CC7E26C
MSQLFNIYPNKKQITFIHKTIGCSRFVYNYFTGKQKEKDHYCHTVNEMVQTDSFFKIIGRANFSIKIRQSKRSQN